MVIRGLLPVCYLYFDFERTILSKVILNASPDKIEKASMKTTVLGENALNGGSIIDIAMDLPSLGGFSLSGVSVGGRVVGDAAFS